MGVRPRVGAARRRCCASSRSSRCRSWRGARAQRARWWPRKQRLRRLPSSTASSRPRFPSSSGDARGRGTSRGSTVRCTPRGASPVSPRRGPRGCCTTRTGDYTAALVVAMALCFGSAVAAFLLKPGRSHEEWAGRDRGGEARDRERERERGDRGGAKWRAAGTSRGRVESTIVPSPSCATSE